MPKLTVSPRGFALAVSAPVVQETPNQRVLAVDGDEEVTLLFNEYFSGKPETKSWAFRAQTLKAAKRLIGRSLAHWAREQVKNPYLDENGIRFIADTAKFIKEGRRELDLLNWLPLLKNTPKEGIVSSRRFKLTPDHFKALDAAGVFYLQAWLKQKGGFEDLLITLYCLFGSVDNRKAFEDAGAEQVVSPKNFKVDMLRRALASG